MPASRNKRKRSDFDQGRGAAATARRGSSKSSSGNELKRAKNEARKETEPVAVIDIRPPSQVAELLPVKSTISQDSTEQNESSNRDDYFAGSAEAIENVPPPAQRLPASIADTGIDDNNPQQTQSAEIQSTVNEILNGENEFVDAATTRTSRRSQIISAVNHRKLLLKRIRQCASAARARVSSIIRSDSKDEEGEKGMIGLKNADISLALPSLDEVESFRELSRLASQSVKRQRTEEGESNRPSLSLRRGASVGKRMNAALSSLQPGGNIATSSIDPVSIATTTAVGDSQVPLAAPSIVPKSNVPQSSQTSVPSQGSSVRPTQQPQQVLQQPQNQLPLPPASGTVGKTTQSQPKEKTKRAGALKQPKLSQSTTLSEQYAPAALPLHQRSGSSTLPPNRLAQPKVICSETRALREKRGDLRKKLSTLRASGSKPSKETSGTQNLQVTQHKQFQSSPAFESKKPSQGDRLSCESFEEGRCSLSHLPKRRKSHWDYVLDEMRWMATDFVEERKWKKCAARMLAFAVIPGAGNHALSSPAAHQATQSEQAASQGATSTQCAVKCDGPNEKDPKANGKPLDSSPLGPEFSNCYSRLRRYERPTPDDTTESQRVAKEISGLYLSFVMVDSRAQSGSHFSFVDDSENGLRPVSFEISFDGAQGLKSQENGKNKKGGFRTTKDGFKDSQAEPDIKETAASLDGERKRSRDEFSKYIEDLCLRAKDFHITNPTKRVWQAQLPDSLELSQEQKEAIRFAEYIWSEINPAGVVVGGPAFAGKTNVVCSLFWMYRERGPQLLVCSSASVVRWELELRRFSGLRAIVLSWDPDNANSKPEFKQGDVVLCQYSLVSNSHMPDLSCFDAIVVDCRGPFGFLGSIDSVKLQRGGDCHVPSALDSAEWWESVLDNLPPRHARRILVDNCSIYDVLGSKLNPCAFSFEEVGILALKTCFVLGPEVYAGLRSTRTRNIISWARRSARAIPDSGKGKAERVTAVLLRAFSSFSYYFKHSPMNDSNASTVWEVRRCTLPDSQRAAYKLACKEVRGILSKGLDERRTNFTGRDHNEAIVNSLLRLRRVCNHAELDNHTSQTAMAPSHSRGNNRGSHDVYCSSSTFFRRIKESASQPDFERARSILLGSGKIRDLAAILINDCGCRIAGEDALSALIPDRGNKTKVTRPRIVLLAELPEVQLLVSSFLCAVGLQHDLLLNIGVEDLADETDGIDDSGKVALAWIEQQLCLLKFNSFETAKQPERSHSIVVGSPTGLGADHGGLGVQFADMVICIDEDWSGRCALVMRSIVAQARRWNNTKIVSGNCSFVRLVSYETCEEDFVTSLKSLQSFLLTTDEFGVVMDVTSSGKRSGIARRLWNFRGQDLSTVLRVPDDLPAVFASRSRQQFLPLSTRFNNHSESEWESERCLIHQLLHWDQHSVGRSVWLSIYANVSHCLHQQGGAIALVFLARPSHLPAWKVTSNDRSSLATRFFLGYWTKLASLKQVAPDSLNDQSNSDNVSIWNGQGVDTATKTDCSDFVAQSCRPADLAASLLLYAPAVDADEFMQKQKHPTPSKVKLLEHKRSDKLNVLVTTANGTRQQAISRINAFAESYCLTRIETTMRDGNQGCESAVYFPPLFPSLVSPAYFDSQRFGGIHLSETKPTEELKRKQPDNNSSSVLPNSKRMKAPAISAGSWDVGSNAGFPPPSQVAPPSPRTLNKLQTPHKAVTPTTATFDPRAPFILHEVFGPDSELEYLRILNEDFGLVGNGLLPSCMNAAEVVECSTISSDLEIFYCGDNLPCDAEEAERIRITNGLSPLHSFIVFVPKQKPRASLGSIGQSFRGNQSVVGELQWSATPNTLPPTSYTGSNNGSIVELNGGTKKTKKKAPGPLPPLGPSAFSRLPAPDVLDKVAAALQVPSAHSKEHRSRMIISPQVSKFLGKLFDIPSFRMASLRVRNRISERVTRWDRGTSDRGNGLPTLDVGSQNHPWSTRHERNSWVGIVRKLKNPKAQSGDEARQLSVQQKGALRRSLVAPCRVDFGPFQSGFLISPAGTTGITPPRSRIGVSLPMGVKVPQALRENNVPPWSVAEDRKLQECAVRFGLNWVLVSRSLTGFEDILAWSGRRESPNPTFMSFPRSARHCRDRWQTLVKIQPSLASEVRKSEKSMRERAVMRATEIPRMAGKVLTMPSSADVITIGAGNKNVSLLIPSSAMEAQSEKNAAMIDVEITGSLDVSEHPDISQIVPPSSGSRPRRTFAACRAGRSQRVISLALPSLTSGNNLTHVASHPSHMQAVQAVLATANPPSGRAELWPLHILELADKVRSTAARSLPETTSSSTSASARPSSAHSQRSATTATSHNSGGAGGRGVGFPQVPLPPPQRSTSSKGSVLQERPVAPVSGSPSRSPRTAIVPLAAQALPPPPQPPPPPPPAQSQPSLPPPAQQHQHLTHSPPSNPPPDTHDAAPIAQSDDPQPGSS